MIGEGMSHDLQFPQTYLKMLINVGGGGGIGWHLVIGYILYVP